MSRIYIELDDRLFRRARRLTGLRTKKEVIHRALEALVRTEERKGILRYYGSGVWKGDLNALRKHRRRHRLKAAGKPRDGAGRSGS